MTQVLLLGRNLGIAVLLSMLLMPLSAQAQTTKARVQSFFADTPVMIEIARCESKFRQYRSNGSPLYGGYGGGMVGVFQFNERVHSGAAASLGHDLTTLEGNLAYAKHLHALEGTVPWNASRHCWEDALRAQKTKAASSTTLHERLKKLQQLLALYQRLLELRQMASR